MIICSNVSNAYNLQVLLNGAKTAKVFALLGSLAVSQIISGASVEKVT